MATLMSSLLHAQVSVLKAALTCNDTSFRVLLNIHKIWVEGNFKVTSFFMVTTFSSLGGEMRLVGFPYPKMRSLFGLVITGSWLLFV
jgi:hypothetical protein